MLLFLFFLEYDSNESSELSELYSTLLSLFFRFSSVKHVESFNTLSIPLFEHLLMIQINNPSRFRKNNYHLQL